MMKLKLFSSAIFFLLIFCDVNHSHAETTVVVPEQTMVGHDKVWPLGDLVNLNMSDVKEKPKYLTTILYNWVVLDNGRMKFFKQESDGSIFFGSGLTNRNVLVLCSVSYVYFVTDDPKEVSKVTNVVVKNKLFQSVVALGDEEPAPPSPTPPTPPAPPVPPAPEPEPTFEDGKFKLAALAYRTAREKVSADNLKGAAALTQSFQGIASAIAAGTMKDIKTILENTNKSNNAALRAAGINTTTWDAWGTVLQQNLYKLYSDKKMVTPEDFGAAWNEIANGLSKIK